MRGFAAPSMTRVLERDLGFRVERVIGIGIAPVASIPLPHPLRHLAHTIIWVLRKPASARTQAPNQRGGTRGDSQDDDRC